MSVATYTSQVNRLQTEIASLRSKLADERKRLADANGKTLRALESLNRASSASQLGSKARDLERCQKTAAAIEKKAADLEVKIAAKARSLQSAESSLTTAQKQEQQKNDREAERRRKADRDHLKAMEQERRAALTFPPHVEARPATALRPQKRAGIFSETYDVCLSFAGEQRDYVKLVASELSDAGLKVFYDDDDQVKPMLWGENLGEALDYVYREGSRFCVMFVSAEYATKSWTIHERRSALARAIDDGGDAYVLPVRFDDTELPGLNPTIGYLEAKKYAPATLAEFVTKKLSGTE